MFVARSASLIVSEVLCITRVPEVGGVLLAKRRERYFAREPPTDKIDCFFGRREGERERGEGERETVL